MPVVYETETPLAPRSGLGPYREADYLGLPDEPRCELLYGRLLVTPAPTARHQQIVVKIVRILADCADRHGDEALVSPIDVVLADHSVVQPDVIYVRAARSSIIRDRIEGAPDLVVEVLSPGTARRDLGVRSDDGFRLRLPDGPVYRSVAIPGLELDPEAFWRSIPTR